MSNAQSAARTAVAPIQVRVIAGEVVVREGSVVTEQDVEKLRALDLADPAIDLARVLGHLGWALLIAGVLALFIERYAEETWADDRRVILVGSSLVVLVLVGRVTAPGTLLLYFAPFAAVAMMLTILAGGRTALATQIAGALHAGIMSGSVELVAYVLVPALLGMAAVQRATTAREFAAGAGHEINNPLTILQLTIAGCRAQLLPYLNVAEELGKLALGAVERRVLDTRMKTHRSQSPMTTSFDPITATTSAIRPPWMMDGNAWMAMNDGARIFTRQGRFVPSETTYVPCSPRGPSTAKYTSPAGTVNPCE